MSDGRTRFAKINKIFYRLTNGVLGGRLRQSTVLLLTTTGRKSGQPRTTPLRFLKHGDDYVVAASNWGQAEPPDWFKNLQANSTAKIQDMSQHINVRAEVASGDLHDSLYERFIEADYRFRDYPQTANRVIPVVLLHPQL